MDRATSQRALIAHWQQPSPPPADQSGGQRLRRLIGTVRRHGLIAGILFFGVFAMVVLFAATRPRIYTATAGMVVNSRELNISEKDKEVLPGLPTALNAADTEVEILRSTAVAQRTVAALDLVHNPWFAKKLEKVAQGDQPAVATAILAGGLKIVRPSQSNVVSISFSAEDPALARTVADEIARQYLAVKESSRRAAVGTVDKGLEGETEGLRRKLEAAEADVARYKAAHNLLSTDGVTLTEQELSLYKQQDAAARAALAQEAARRRTAREQMAKGSHGDDVGAALQSPVIQQLRQQRAELSTRIAELKDRYRPGHPDLVRAEAQAAALDRSIDGEIHRVVSNLDANTRIASVAAANARATASATSGTLAANDAAAVGLNELQRKADGLKETYASLLTRRNAIRSQALIADEDARLLSPALLPLRPSSPNMPLMLVLGVLLAGIAASAAVWLRSFLERGIGSAREAQAQLGLPHLASLPLIGSIARGQDRQLPPADFVVHRPISLYGEALRAIWIELVHGRIAGAKVTVGITSSRADEGKTTLAVSLARASAMAGVRTLLIDGDLRRPAVARTLGMTPSAGLAEVLRGQVALEDAIVRDSATDLHVLPVAAPQATIDELFDEAHVGALIDDCRDAYEIILFDVAPCLMVADARLLLKQLDDVVLAVQWRKTAMTTAAAAIDKLRAIGIEPRGLVLTQVDVKQLAQSGEGEADYGGHAYSPA